MALSKGKVIFKCSFSPVLGRQKIIQNAGDVSIVNSEWKIRSKGK